MLPNLNGSVSVKVVLIFRETGSEYSCKWCYTSGIYSYAIRMVLNNFLTRLNEKIASFNELLKSKCSQYVYYVSYYQSTYVQRQIQKPEELLKALCAQMDIMQVKIKPISITNKDLCKFIDNAIVLLDDNNYTLKERIDYITDRIYDREQRLIKKFKEKRDEFSKIREKTYQLENDIKIETERRIKNNKNILPNSLIIEHAKNNGLLATSFELSE